MYLLTFKALHIVGFVAWFAGIFYLVRLFVYHVEAMAKTEPERSVLSQQFLLMERRLFKVIITPAMILTFTGGIAMLIINTGYLKEGWMHLKLTLIFLLSAYSDGWCRIALKKLSKSITPGSSQKMRIMNEVPTFFLISIVILAVFRNTLSLVAILGVMVGSILLLGLFFYVYAQNSRKKSGQ